MEISHGALILSIIDLDGFLDRLYRYDIVEVITSRGGLWDVGFVDWYVPWSVQQIDYSIKF